MEDEEGGIAEFSNESIHMAQIAVNQIDASGGVNCHSLKLFVADSTSSASAAANTLVLQDHVSALIGISYSSEALAVMPFLSANHVITIMTTAGMNGMLNNLTSDYSAYQYFFRIEPNDIDYAQSVMNYTATVLKPSSVYFVAEDESFQHEIFQNITTLAASDKVTIAGSTFVPLSQTDFSTTAATVAEANPGLVIDCQTGSGVGSFIQDLRAANSSIKILYMCNGALADPGFQGYLLSTTPTLLNGVLFQIQAGTAKVPLNNVTTYVSTQYSQVMGQFFPYYSFVSNAYTAVQVLAASMRQAGSVTNTSAIVQAMQTVSYTGPTGTVKFDSLHHWTPEFWYTQFQNGSEVVIYPKAYANGSYNSTAS